MEGTLILAQTTSAPPVLRIEGGHAAIPASPSNAVPQWILPAGAGAMLLGGVCIAVWGVVWLRRKPTRAEGGDEIFEKVAKALGTSASQREAAQIAGGAGVPSPLGRLVWPAR